MTTLNELTLVDTNVLVYAVQQDAPNHLPARALLNRAQNGELSLCVTPQVLAEFFAVVTDRRRVTEPRSTQEATEAIDKFLAVPGMRLLAPPLDIVQRWTLLARERGVIGPAIFDVQLVATMQAHGVQQIYTYNRDHFQGFADLAVLTP